MKKKELSEAAKLIAAKGGRACLKKHGKKHYKDMAKSRWEKSTPKTKNKKKKRGEKI
jgi:hypothetical protein